MFKSPLMGNIPKEVCIASFLFFSLALPEGRVCTMLFKNCSFFSDLEQDVCQEAKLQTRSSDRFTAFPCIVFLFFFFVADYSESMHRWPQCVFNKCRCRFLMKFVQISQHIFECCALGKTEKGHFIIKNRSARQYLLTACLRVMTLSREKQT